ICFFFQAEDGIRDSSVTGVQTCALPIFHCGEEVDPYDTFCPECGLEPDPGRTEQQRLAAIVQHGRGRDGHARSVLKQESYAASEIGRASCRERGEIWGGAAAVERERWAP